MSLTTGLLCEVVEHRGRDFCSLARKKKQIRLFLQIRKQKSFYATHQDGKAFV